MTRRSLSRVSAVVSLVLWRGVAGLGAGGAQPPDRRPTITLRGRAQTLHLYGPSDGTPVIVTSGDGGWMHLAPHVADLLASKGFFVVGFDARAYLESFTQGGRTLRAEDEPGDYQTLIAFAARTTGRKPVLIGSSEGAGLSVLAAADPTNRDAVGGVIGLGLPNITELAWRWRDMVIYVTHRPPNEPFFRVTTVVDRLAPVPLAAIHSTHDEYVPLTEVEGVLATASEPKRLWVVDAGNHHFGDNLAAFDRSLLEAVAWVGDQRTGGAR
jgi:fermentation-respiration switch protein FrsA (DUF1100 family)